MHLICKNAKEAGVRAIQLVVEHGKVENRRVGPWCLKKDQIMEIKELHNVAIEIRDPLDRITKFTGVGTIVETLDTLMGLNKDAFIDNVLPVYKRWKKPGGGYSYAYGDRLQNYGGFNQWVAMAERLQRDPTTRQAIMPIWYPAIDTISDYVPCPVMLHFQYYEGKLNLSVLIRSQDCVKGGLLNLDCFLWATVLEKMCIDVSLQVGTLTIFESNMHIYSVDYEKAEKILKEELEVIGETGLEDKSGMHHNVSTISTVKLDVAPMVERPRMENISLTYVYELMDSIWNYSFGDEINGEKMNYWAGFLRRHFEDWKHGHFWSSVIALQAIKRLFDEVSSVSPDHSAAIAVVSYARDNFLPQVFGTFKLVAQKFKWEKYNVQVFW